MTKMVSKRQQRLATLLRSTSDTIRVTDAMEALGFERAQASKLLAAWHNQGVLRRVARGLYVPVSPRALGQSQVLEDPWILVPELYAPGYIGGWSALEHWELTEQLFRSVCVLTNKRTAYGQQEYQGVGFFVKYTPEKNLFATKTLWRESTKLLISDLPKTVLDVIDDPYLGAGLQHTVDCLMEFKKRDNAQEISRMIEYAQRLNNGALFKKLGFLAERLEFDKSFIAACAARLTTGYAYLDKSAKNNKLATKWRLWVPEGFDH
jgi:predicted transcriptional regulator of viral defense system